MLPYMDNGENISHVTEQNPYADMCMWSALGSVLILILLPFFVEPLFGVFSDKMETNFPFLLFHNSFYHVCIFIFFAGYAAKKHPRESLLKILDIHAPSWEKAKITGKCLLLTWFLVFVASSIMSYIQKALGKELALQNAVLEAISGNWTNYFVILIPAVVVAPIIEEMMFRRFGFGWLSQHVPRTAAAIIVSAVFSLMHFNLLQALPLFVLAMCLQYTYARTKSLLEPMVIHAIVNSSTAILILLYRLGFVSAETFNSSTGFLF